MLGSINKRGKVSEPCLSSPIITLQRGTFSIPPRPPQSREKGGSGKPAAERPQKGGRLLIRVPQMEGEQWEKLQLLFSIFEGETPLLVRAADTGRLLKAGEEYNTDANPVLLGELRRVLGQENVALLPPEAPKAPPEPALQ